MKVKNETTVIVNGERLLFDVEIIMFDNLNHATLRLKCNSYDEYCIWRFNNSTMIERIKEIATIDYKLIKGE